ncbi:MAG: hypothetical protein AUJ80_00700 [Gallionellaceae bacterium CG1_02_60_325]|nr:MAG: hypothetical protein AUJ80_00700 [Gallionellaceae bacterium CG1_02_60_325]
MTPARLALVSLMLIGSPVQAFDLGGLQDKLGTLAQPAPSTAAAAPAATNGRALAMDAEQGSTKVLLDPKSRRILGMGIVGVNAGELIAEAVLALEMGADMEDLGLTIHPHPTLSETLCFAAEMAEGTITDLLPPRKK